jgi:hypothetical protein
MKNEKNISIDIAEVSIAKAVSHAVLIPFVLYVALSITTDAAIAFYGTIGWMTALSLMYKLSETKQLTAYFFFWILKAEAVIAGVYILFLFAMYLIARFA